jgi:hypothetical protein
MALAQKDLIHELDHSMPAASDAQLGTIIEELQNTVNLLLAKLDADAGVTDTNFAATLKITKLSEK